jgi:esterase/lipase superfamily enzyme
VTPNSGESRGALPVLYIHGFANSFDDALCRAAQIAEFYEGAGVPLAPLVFSWPSDGVVVSPDDILNPIGSAMKQYRFDQDQAWASGAAGARLIGAAVQARARTGTPRLALLAHSMGNHALASALAQLGEAGVAALAGGIHEILLVAADVAHDSLEPGRPLRHALTLGRRVTVVINLDPTLSKISRIVNSNSRLGMYGPIALESLEGRAEVVDCYVGLEWSKVPIEETAGGATTWDTVLHQYYRNDRNVRADLAEVLAGRAPSRRRVLEPEQRRVIALDGRARQRFSELVPSRVEIALSRG